MSERIYLGNLSYTVDHHLLAAELSNFGIPAENVKVVTDRETGQHRGFGFADVESAKAAIEVLDGQLVAGRPLRVDRATERPRGAPRTQSKRPRDTYEEDARADRSRGRR